MEYREFWLIVMAFRGKKVRNWYPAYMEKFIYIFQKDKSFLPLFSSYYFSS